MSSFVDAYSELERDGLADGEQPFCDFVFDLVESDVGRKRWFFGPDERSFRGRAMASTPRGDIGFRFELEPVNRWREQVNEQLKTAWGCVTLQSLGEPTDRLIREYRDWFGLDGDLEALSEVCAPAVVIGGNLAQYEKEKVHTKLFLHHAEEDDTYAEVFLNFDLPRARVELKEKDEAYRPVLVGWLEGRFGQPDRDWLQ